MATLKIREFNSCHVGYGGVVMMAQEPAVTDQVVIFLTEAKSAAFNVDTRFICIQADADCCFAIGTNPTATMSMIGVEAGEKYFTGVSPGMKISVIAGDSFFLLYDNFESNPGGVGGRIPNLGPAWGIAGPDAAYLAVSDGTLIQTAGPDVAMATSALGAIPGEIGCTFLTQPDIWMGLTIAGTPAEGLHVLVQIIPSGQDGVSFQNITYTLTSEDDLESAAAGLAALCNDNSYVQDHGITATAIGATVRFTATETPHIDGQADPPLSVGAANPGTPTLACFTTGTDFNSAMVHFLSISSGELGWSLWASGMAPFDSYTKKRFHGLQASTEYTMRCCIGAGDDAGYVWGGIWHPDGTLVSAALGSAASMASYAGQSAFWETGLTGTPYTQAWCLKQPSISRVAITAALG